MLFLSEYVQQICQSQYIFSDLKNIGFTHHVRCSQQSLKWKQIIHGIVPHCPLHCLLPNHQSGLFPSLVFGTRQTTISITNGSRIRMTRWRHILCSLCPSVSLTKTSSLAQFCGLQEHCSLSAEEEMEEEKKEMEE